MVSQENRLTVDAMQNQSLINFALYLTGFAALALWVFTEVQGVELDENIQDVLGVFILTSLGYYGYRVSKKMHKEVSEMEKLDGEWNEYRRLILWDLDRLNKNLTKIADDVDKTRTEMVRVTESIGTLKTSLDKFMQVSAENTTRLVQVEREIAIFKAKASLLGAIAGTGVTFFWEIFRYFFNGKI